MEERLLERNQLFETFFVREAPRLAEACREMSERFLRGGRLLAFGRGPYATDAQHVSVEFVHPVIVGKRALPALDLSILFRPWMEAILRPEDIVMGFGPPEGDPEVWATLQEAHLRDAMTFALPGTEGSYGLETAIQDPFMHQELVEILYHTLWETVHVFFEHRELGHEVGASEFLYPFLGRQKQGTTDLIGEVAASILMKVQDDARLRAEVARDESEQIGATALAIHERLKRGGKLIIFGNGGSATDANDFAIDCVLPPVGYQSGARSFAFARARQHYSSGKRHRNRSDLPSPAYCAGPPRRCRDRHLNQRRIAQHHHGTGRGAQTESADGGAAGLRRWRNQAQADSPTFPSW